jgi:hypothetical protein
MNVIKKKLMLEICREQNILEDIIREGQNISRNNIRSDMKRKLEEEEQKESQIF